MLFSTQDVCCSNPLKLYWAEIAQDPLTDRLIAPSPDVKTVEWASYLIRHRCQLLSPVFNVQRSSRPQTRVHDSAPAEYPQAERQDHRRLCAKCMAALQAENLRCGGALPFVQSLPVGLGLPSSIADPYAQQGNGRHDVSNCCIHLRCLR